MVCREGSQRTALGSEDPGQSALYQLLQLPHSIET